MISRRRFVSSLFALAPALLGSLVWPRSAQALLSIGGTLPALNQAAPEFTLPSNTGDTLSLRDFRGQWVVLYFYPQDFTSGCTLEAQRFQRDYPQYLSRNVQILGISADDVASHADFCDAEGLRFPLLADVKGEVSRAYGSWYAFRSLRHTFLIDPEGILREQFLRVNPILHSKQVLARLDKLQHRDMS